MSTHELKLPDSPKATEITIDLDEVKSSEYEEIHYFVVKLHPDIQAQLDEITAALKRLESKWE